MSSELRRCQARSKQKMGLQCEGQATGVSMHNEDHWATVGDDTIFHWKEEVAMYPVFGEPADISAQVLAEKGARHGQVGGDHYRKHRIQPWDVWDEYDLDRYTANVVKYLLRAGDKGPKIEDLKKARHYLDKAIEREEQSGGT